VVLQEGPGLGAAVQSLLELPLGGLEAVVHLSGAEVRRSSSSAVALLGLVGDGQEGNILNGATIPPRVTFWNGAIRLVDVVGVIV
jgi:hypothetical protein